MAERKGRRQFFQTLCILTLGLAGLAAGFALPQHGWEGEKPIPGLSLEELMNIKVKLGTRGEVRSAFSALIPVEVITGRELRDTGQADLGAALQRLLPCVDYPCPMIMDVTDHSNPLGFRGLSPDQVLVLVNGKRRHPSALVNNNSRVGKGSQHVDLNAFPLEGIDRVEVLRDGAAAQYGSDAIAGIINIILKDFAPSSFAVQAGVTAEGDGCRGFVAEHLHFPVKSSGYANLTAEVRERGHVNRAEADARQQYFDGDPRNELPPRVSQEYGESSQANQSFVWNALLPLNRDTSVYSFATLNHRTGESPGYFRTAADSRNVRAIHPDGFLPMIAPEITDFSALAGIRTEIAGWDADFSSVFGRNAIDIHVNNSVNTSLGNDSPTSFYCGSLRFSQWTSNADLYRDLDIGLHRPLEIGFGFEFRRESYEIRAGEPASYLDGGVPILDGPLRGTPATPGAQVFPGFNPTDETRNTRYSLAVYFDVENQLADTVRAQAAGRFEWADDYGSTLTWKSAVRWEPRKSFALRFSAGTGFRAPSLAQAHFHSTATNYMDGLPYQNGTFPVTHPLAVQLGATPLKPEKSFHLSGGAVLQFDPDLSLSVDGYYTRVDNRVVLSGSYTRTNAPLLADLLESYNVGGAQFFTNAVDMRSQGVDASLRYSLTTATRGAFLFSASANLNQVKILRIHMPPAVSPYPEIFFSRAERARLETYNPRLGFRGVANYRWRSLDALFRVIYYSGITIVNSASKPEYDQKLAGGFVFDAQLAWKFARDWELAVGGHNVFNQYPERLAPVPGDAYTGNILPYHPFSPFGIAGASVYVRLRYGR